MSIVTNGTVQQSFEVGTKPQLAINVNSGEVFVQAGEGSTIRVDAISGSSRPDRLDVECHQHGDTVKVRSHRGDNHAEFHITVPRGCLVEATTIRADVTIAGTMAPVVIETVSGDLTVEGVSGECRLHTVGGDVNIRQMEGSLILQTTNGDVTIHDSELTRFNVHSANGEFEIATPLTAGSHYFAKTVNGDVRLIVPSDTGVLVQLRTHNGEISSDLPMEMINRSRRNWQARINGGGANLEMESVNGDLRISSDPTGSVQTRHETNAENAYVRQDAPGVEAPGVSMPAPEAPSPPSAFEPERASHLETNDVPAQSATASHEQTIAILAELEQGNLTVEEAMAQLDALR